MTPVAFAAAWDVPLTEEERERLLDGFVRIVRRWGLETPATFALEMHRPLAFIGSQGLITLTPMLGPLLGLDWMQKLSRLLAEPGAIDALIARLEDPSPPVPLSHAAGEEVPVARVSGSESAASADERDSLGTPSPAAWERGTGGEGSEGSER